MIHKLLILFLVFSSSLFAQISYDDLHDGSGGITDGYGAWGDFTVIEEAGITVPDKGIITLYHPDIADSTLPTIFFISGWGREAVTYEKFFYFLASQGYSVVNIYNFDPGDIVNSYQNSLDMMILSANTHYPDWINTDRIGLMGHSYGAGSTIWLGKEIFSEPHNWGTEGRFIFMTAPWYSLVVTAEDLFNYPEDVKLLIEINNDDVSEHEETWNTDERAIRAVFELINIPNSEKDFVRVFSDPTTFEFDSDGDEVDETFSYDASHFLSYTGITTYGVYRPWDALDVYAINRLSHALIDYAFYGNETAKEMALGNGNTTQTDMGFLTDLVVTDTPIITRPESEFHYKCSEGWGGAWFLQDACEDSDGDGIIDMIASINEESQMHFSLYPVPASHEVYIRLIENFDTINQIEIRDITGKLVYQIEQPTINTINLSNFVSGNYFIKVQTETQVGIRAFIVK